jgi:hypothetical protein
MELKDGNSEINLRWIGKLEAPNWIMTGWIMPCLESNAKQKENHFHYSTLKFCVTCTHKKKKKMTFFFFYDQTCNY